MQLAQEILVTLGDFFPVNNYKLSLLQQDFVTITKMKKKKQINR